MRKIWEIYTDFVKAQPIHSSAIQVAILGIIGEILASYIRGKGWCFSPIQLFAKTLCWAFLGITFKYAFVGFTGFVDELRKSEMVPFVGSMWVRAFFISFFCNLLFGPPMMLLHRWIDVLIMNQSIDWNSMVKAWWTLAWFWVPAHTITFKLPRHYQVSLAAVWAVALGIILGYFARV